MTKQLIINVDDFGRSEAVNRKIASAIEKGAISSASLLANFPATSHALDLARRHAIDLGWHINLTEGVPVSLPGEVHSLVRPDGSFYPLPLFLIRLWLRRITLEEVERELRAQLERIAASGVITHLDGHHHVQVMPVVREAVRKIVMERQIPYLRIPSEPGGLTVPRFAARLFLRLQKGSHGNFWETTQVRSLPFYGLSISRSGGTQQSWRRLLKRISSETAELMVHQEELPLLSNHEWKALLHERGFEQVSFRDLPP